MPIVDTLVATLLFSNGAVGSLVQADSGHTPLTSKFSFQVMDGIRTAHLHHRLMSTTMWDGDRALRHDDGEETGMIEESRAFLAAIRNHTPPPVGVRDGLRATVVLLRAFESMSTRQPRDIRL
jgi:predicted dehydrogenase